ncbi:MAG: glycoside hydrolase family 5 protein [Ruminococcus sp.]|nr:glycoside hydrolase family 5 protein [Ruminococcus sp.]
MNHKKRKRRSIITSIFALLLTLVTITSCNDTTPTDAEVTAATTTTTTAAATEPAAEATTTTAAPETEPAVTEPEISDMVPELNIDAPEITMNPALELVKDMKVGWNLGNTFDANDGNAFNPDTELNYETSWTGAPKTSKENILAIKNAGFNTIRVPVSWHNHVIADEDGNFTISLQWLDRVQEVIDLIYEEDMYIILNIHHDNIKGYYYPTSEFFESTDKYITSIWTQLADRFGDYGEKLIFESINEPRASGTPSEWNILNTSVEEQLDILNCVMAHNQTFVDIIRASEHENNKTRYLMVPSATAKAGNAMLDAFELPTDTADNRIILSVHEYTPYNFALAPQPGNPNFSVDNSADTNPINSFMENLYFKFVEKGIPVVIGEWGAVDRDGNLQARVDFAAYYTAKARSLGISTVWWDNGAFSGNGEIFGILDRTASQLKFPELIDALMAYTD